MVENVTNDEKFNSGRPVIVDFWAPWCGPCQIAGPVFEELSKEYDGRVEFYKASVEEARELAAKNEVRSIPCFVMFKDGKEVDRITGFGGREKLKEAIEKLL